MADHTATEQVRGLGEDISALVRHEMQRGRAEMAAKAQQSTKGAALLAAAGALAAGAAGTSTVLLIRLLDRIMPPRAAALTATAGLGGGAAALAVRAIGELERVGSLIPEQTIRDTRQGISEDRTES